MKITNPPTLDCQLLNEMQEALLEEAWGMMQTRFRPGCCDESQAARCCPQLMDDHPLRLLIDALDAHAALMTETQSPALPETRPVPERWRLIVEAFCMGVLHERLRVAKGGAA